MLRPSYSELMQVLNDNPNLDNRITSRYAVVVASAKRARQIVEASKLPENAFTSSNLKVDKAVSLAVAEMAKGLISITPSVNDVADNSFNYDGDQDDLYEESFISEIGESNEE